MPRLDTIMIVVSYTNDYATGVVCRCGCASSTWRCSEAEAFAGCKSQDSVAKLFECRTLSVSSQTDGFVSRLADRVFKSLLEKCCMLCISPESQHKLYTVPPPTGAAGCCCCCCCCCCCPRFCRRLVFLLPPGLGLIYRQNHHKTRKRGRHSASQSQLAGEAV